QNPDGNPVGWWFVHKLPGSGKCEPAINVYEGEGDGPVRRSQTVNKRKTETGEVGEICQDFPLLESYAYAADETELRYGRPGGKDAPMGGKAAFTNTVKHIERAASVLLWNDQPVDAKDIRQP